MDVDESMSNHMFLPLRSGGSGLLAPGKMTAHAAYLAATALAEKALQHSLAAFLPFSGPSGEYSQDAYSSLQAELALHKVGELPPLSSDRVLNDIPGLQT